MNEDPKKIQNNQFIFSYFRNYTVYVVLWGLCKNAFLLHNSEEEKKMYLPNGEVVKVENIEESFMVNDSILLYLSFKDSR